MKDLEIGDKVTIDGVGRAHCEVVRREEAQAITNGEPYFPVEGDDWILQEVNGPPTEYRLPVGESETRCGCDVSKGHNGGERSALARHFPL